MSIGLYVLTDPWNNKDRYLTIFLEMLGKNEKFGVVIAVSKAYDSATSFVYAREVDGNEFGGFGKPFQLSRRSNDFSKHEWDNDILTDEKIGLGTILKYEQLGEEYCYDMQKKPSGHQRLLFLSYVTLNCYVITSDYSRVSSRVTQKKHLL